LLKADKTYPKTTNGLTIPYLSETYPLISLSEYETNVATATISPSLSKPECKYTTTKIGKIGFIIADERSVKKLVSPR
jgi:hypothetical protein